jgi:hypothetical protein
MSNSGSPQPPREPEIEFLGKAALGFLVVLRAVFWSAGVTSLYFGWQMLLFPDSGSAAAGSDWTPSALGSIWLSLGIPLVVKADWLLNRCQARRLLILIFILLWFAPMALADDSNYGFILRMFSTMVSFLTMLVWRTLWQLTKPDIESD